MPLFLVLLAETLPSTPVNPTSLPIVVKVAGFLVSWATSIYVLWVRNPPPLLSKHPFFPQVRNISIILIAIFLALSWNFLGNSAVPPYLFVIAIAATLFGILIFFPTAHIISKALITGHHPSPLGLTLLLFAFLLYTASISCGLTSAAVFLTVTLSNQSNAKDGTTLVQPTTYEATVTVRGTATMLEHQEVPFTASSGQVNFGCDEERTAQAQFALPGDATLIAESVSAAWKNFDNAKNPNASFRTEGSTVMARGSIRGLESQQIVFVRNCPGGGHGELVLRGIYRTSKASKEPREVAIQSTLSTASPQPAWLTLPAEDLAISGITVVLREAGKTATAETLTLSVTNPEGSSGRLRATFVPEERKVGLTVS